MIKVALAGLLGRKLRSALTAIAIVLGVAMISGTFVLTDSIDKAFGSIFSEIRQGSNVVVTGKAAFSLDANSNSGTTAPPFDESLLAKVRALPDVRVADGSVGAETQLIGRDGKVIQYGGAPNLGFSIDDSSAPFNPLKLVSGSWPKDGEVVIGSTVADREHYSAGQTIGVQAAGPKQTLRISGIVEFNSGQQIGGATLAGFTLPTAQKLFAKDGKLDEIAIASKPNVSDQRLLAEVQKILPPETQARTATAQAREDASGTNSFISFLRGFLLAFGGIALFVGSFVIANSLSITIAQRTREFATLRTVGASRRQVLQSLIVESLVVGAIASIVGLFLGLGLAKGLFRLFDAVGFTLPNSGLVFATRTVVVALLVGVLVTLLASLRPALRATRVPPIAAVREGAELPPGRFAKYRTTGSTMLTVLGFAALAFGLFKSGLSTTALLTWMGLGALLIFFGVSLLSVRFIRPLAGALGRPAVMMGGAAGSLARDNARRNPQRTASTAAALMIGLALVTLVAVLAAGITGTFRSAVKDIWRNADYAVTAQNNFSPIPTAAADAAAKAPGVDAVASVRTGDIGAYGKRLFGTAVDQNAERVFKLNWTQGSSRVLSTLGADGVFVDKTYAKDHALSVGSPVKVTFANGQTQRFVVRGVFDPPTGGSPFGNITMSAATWDRFNPDPKNLYSFVLMHGGQTPENLARLDRALADFPNAKAQTRQQFVDNQISGLNSVLNILYVLLALSVIVSLFGIVNTLVLTVFERTREIGMLRAIGMTRRQVRRMVRHESVITALIGGVLGIVLGVVLGGLLVARVDFISFVLPVGSLIVFAVATVIVGIVAAIFPARRAARLNVLEALHYE